MTSREVFRILGLIPKVGFQGISFHNDNNNNLLICLVNVVTIICPLPERTKISKRVPTAFCFLSHQDIISVLANVFYFERSSEFWFRFSNLLVSNKYPLTWSKSKLYTFRVYTFLIS